MEIKGSETGVGDTRGANIDTVVGKEYHYNKGDKRWLL